MNDNEVLQERLQFKLTTKELAALDNWRFKHRCPSRAAALRKLLGIALAGEKAAEALT